MSRKKGGHSYFGIFYLDKQWHRDPLRVIHLSFCLHTSSRPRWRKKTETWTSFNIETTSHKSLKTELPLILNYTIKYKITNKLVLLSRLYLLFKNKNSGTNSKFYMGRTDLLKTFTQSGYLLYCRRLVPQSTTLYPTLYKKYRSHTLDFNDICFTFLSKEGRFSKKRESIR